MDTNYSALASAIDALDKAWPEAPVYGRDGLLFVVGWHPNYGYGHFGFRWTRGLTWALATARGPAEAERAIRNTLRLPEGFAFGAAPTAQ